MDLPNLVLVGKDMISGPDGDGGYLSLNVRQVSVVYIKFSKHSSKVS